MAGTEVIKPKQERSRMRVTALLDAAEVVVQAEIVLPLQVIDEEAADTEAPAADVQDLVRRAQP